MDAQRTFQELEEAATFIRSSRGFVPPRVGVVLGSGLGAWAGSLADSRSLPYGEIPHMPQSNVVGHAGNLVIGNIGAGLTVACLQGRVHTYEGHAQDKVVFGARLLARLGCQAILLTNAAGGIKRSFTPGDLMLVTDHLNLLGRNPLVGPNIAELGPRFPDMSDAYAPRLRALAKDAARAAGVDLCEGVYAALLGPTYETPAEIEMLRRLGADAVGMSTVPEVIAMNHMRVPVAAISCITNMAAGMTREKLDHAEVEATAKQAHGKFVALLSTWVEKVGAQLEARA